MQLNSMLKINREVLPFLNMSLYFNNIKAIHCLSVGNNSEDALFEITVTITADIPCIESFSFFVSNIPAKTTVRIPLDQLKVSRDFLSRLSETEKAEISIRIFKQSEVIAVDTFYIEVQPLEHFGGFQVLPQLVASFVTPNHSYIYQLKRCAIQLLESQGLPPSFNGYQSADPARVLQVMSALFTAIQDENIIYSSLAPGYEKTGQRLRLLNTIQRERFANCIDVSLLFAACLEAADLHPVLIVVKGHAFVGCWLTDDKFPEVVNEDKTAITKRLSKGIREIAVIEATTMCKGSDIRFTDALHLGEAQLIEKEDFLLSIDIKTARGAFIRPLPLMNTDIVQLDMDEVEKTVRGKIEDKFEIGKIYKDELLNKSAQPKTKQKIWERKLLDLSLRNNLINLRFSKNVLQLVDINIDVLEDILWDGKSFSIQPHPNIGYQGKYNFYFGPLHSSSHEFQNAISELKYNRLLTYYHQKDLDSILTFMHKNAKQAIDENGSSTLYLGAGLLQWYDRKTPEIPRLSPILLIPVEINRRSINSKFSLKSREEETMINITLLEFLRQEYQMNLSGLEQLPQDEKGVDVAKVMGVIRRAVMQLEGWDVKEQLVLGNFSFSKLILWNDIVVHQEKLLESDMVRSLVEGRLSFSQNIERNEDDFETIQSKQLTLPISTDVSQMDAVLQAQKGQNFILHGPPGTGKSQTITNIIADALYRGKRVLFVAAKKAALDVVYKRLKQIGLEPFTLELHSNKSKKSDVLNQLSKSLETLKRGKVENFEEESRRLDAAKKAISEYVYLLHKQQPFGWSLYTSITALENYRERNFPKHYISENVLEELSSNLWKQWKDWLPQFESIIQLITHPTQNPLSALTVNQYTASISDDIDKKIKELLRSLSCLKSQQSDLINAIYFPFSASSLMDTENFKNLTLILERLPNLPIQFANFLSDPENLELYEDWNQHFGAYQLSLKEILEDYDRSILNANLMEAEVKWKEANQSWFLTKWLKKNAVKKQLNIHRSHPLTKDTQVTELFSLNHKMLENYEISKHSRFAELVLAFKSLYKEGDTDLKEIEMRVVIIKQISKEMGNWGYRAMANWMQNLINKGVVYSDELTKHSTDLFQSYRNSFEEFVKHEVELNKISGYKFIKDNGWLEKNSEKLSNIQSHLFHLRNWINYQQIAAKGTEMRMGWLISAYERNDFDTSDVADYFHYTVHLSLSRRLIAEHEPLILFNGKLLESKIEHYKHIARDYKVLTIREIYGKLASQLPDCSTDAMQSSEPGILQRAIRSKGRGTSIRRLFDQIPNLLPRLAPCMLMSPISVAQYFDVDTKHFDLLIFDEASQLPTCEAVSSLGRAKQAIIVGDPKQMPPTSFFTTTKLDEENIEIEDMESILDDCLSLNLPSKHLLRHYRSRHESLIAFSNANYYENKLLTFPSADDLQRKVQYQYVEGVYDKGKTRTNKFEADAIVHFVKGHFENEKKRKLSVGIVTFSQTQQALIAEKLDQLFSLNPQVEEWANETDEPLFIKNLENVQGDERDIILFSVGYAPDENGKMSMNFGPLNRDGGWRRLNVAVTRARYEMRVFSTLNADQIDLSRTSTEGVVGLKSFLNFAEKGQLAVQPTDKNDEQTRQQLSEIVGKRLIEKGLKVKCNIGTSGFKIDIGIVHPENPHRFILGIVIDGYYYYNAKTSNDRELVMPTVLKSLGWNVYRIWSLEWHENAQQIVDAIFENVNSLLAQPEHQELCTEVTEKPSFEPSRMSPIPQQFKKVDTLQKAYVPIALTPLSFSNVDAIFDFQNRNTLKQQIHLVVEVESPISKNTLYRRILSAWNIARVGSRLEKMLGEIISEMEVKEVIHNQPFYYSSSPVTTYRSNDVEKRKVEDIAPEEIVVAIEEAVKNHLSINEDELIKYLARLFDFGRVGRQVEASIKLALDLASQQQKIVKDGGRIKLVSTDHHNQ